MSPHPVTKTVGSFERKAPRMSAIVRAMEEVGPDVAEIARRTKEPAESVRYILKTKIFGKGLGVYAIYNAYALGLTKRALIADLAAPYSERTWDLFNAMEEKWFLTYSFRMIPEGTYAMIFDVPDGREEDFTELIQRMQEVGFIKKVHDDLGFEWRRNNEMRAELFDFKRSEWDFDWTKLPVRPAPPIPVAKKIEEIHLADLGLMAELWVDSARSLAELAKPNEMSVRSAVRHMRHVKEKGFSTGYRVNWMKSQKLNTSGRYLTSPHKYLVTGVFVRGITQQEQRKVRDALNRLPFLWVEAGGNNYFAELIVPLALTNETIQFIHREFTGLSHKTRFYILDWGSGMSSSTPRHLFDPKRQQWVYEPESQVRDLEAAMAKVATVPK
ncbi:MAG: hypothetical protein OK456_05700 [Thaumarchaeota archaeon]|nr:hypothetical protein [Nitrososphaerota archaeon]